MPPTLEFGRQETIDYGHRLLARGAVGAQSEYVGIVMLAREPCGVRIVGQCRTNASHLIGRDRHTDPGSTGKDSEIVVAFGDAISDLDGEIGVIHGSCRPGANVIDFIALGLQVLFYGVFNCETGMVGTKGHARLFSGGSAHWGVAGGSFVGRFFIRPFFVFGSAFFIDRVSHG